MTCARGARGETREPLFNLGHSDFSGISLGIHCSPLLGWYINNDQAPEENSEEGEEGEVVMREAA